MWFFICSSAHKISTLLILDLLIHLTVSVSPLFSIFIERVQDKTKLEFRVEKFNVVLVFNVSTFSCKVSVSSFCVLIFVRKKGSLTYGHELVVSFDTLISTITLLSYFR